MSIPNGVAQSTRVWPDVHSSNDAYSLRFNGGIGGFFLNVQSKEVVDAMTACRAQNVLDVGGGHCQIAELLADLQIDVTVTGSTGECDQRLRNHVPDDRYTFVNADPFPLPFETDSFDVCASIRMISHLEDWPKLIAELCRVARSAVVVDFSAQTWNRRFSRLVLSAKRSVEHDTRPFLTQSMAEISREFASHGFRVKRTFRQFAIPMAAHRLIGVPHVSRFAERMLRTFGVTQCIGSPVIVTAVPKERSDS